MNSALEQRIELEKIGMVCRSSVNIFGGLIVLGAIIVYLIALDHSWWVAGAWYGVLLVISAVRWTYHARFLSHDRSIDETLRWRYIVLAGAAATGAMWSIPGTWLLPHSLTMQLFLCGCIMGIAAAAVAALAPLRNAYLWFVTPFLLPVGIAQLIQGADNIAIGLGLLLFMGAMVGMAARYHADVSKMLRLSIDNEDLAMRLVRENKRVEQANSDLQDQIAERERAELSLRVAKAEAEEANRAKSQFLANMSHEVRTPLNAIMGMTELLRRSPLNSKQTKFADTAFSAGERLLGIINDILDLSRVEAGRLRLHQAQFSPRKWLLETVELMSAQATLKKLSISYNVHADVPMLLQGDPERLRQVLTNLIANAIKFTDAGKIHIELRVVDGVLPQAMAPDSCLRCAVSDTGMGIALEAQHRLFKPFSQIDDSTTRRFGGTGLGLAICRQLVEAMGGRIGLESEVGAGSTFWFEVPFDIVEPESHVQSLRTTAELHAFDAHVLVAEDNDVNRELLVEMLNIAGCSVAVARSGREAMEKLMDKTFDAVLMDWHMPELDGLTATRLLRARDVRARTTDNKLPVIALTASVMDGDKETCLAAGVDDYLPKPFSYPALVSTLRRWLPARSQPYSHP